MQKHSNMKWIIELDPFLSEEDAESIDTTSKEFSSYEEALCQAKKDVERLAHWLHTSNPEDLIFEIEG